MKLCEKHPKIEMVVGECGRCGGDGYTESDLDTMNDPMEWHNSGDCYQCKGTGKGSLECPVCEDDFRMQQEMEDNENHCY